MRAALRGGGVLSLAMSGAVCGGVSDRNTNSEREAVAIVPVVEGREAVAARVGGERASARSLATTPSTGRMSRSEPPVSGPGGNSM